MCVCCAVHCHALSPLPPLPPPLLLLLLRLLLPLLQAMYAPLETHEGTVAPQRAVSVVCLPSVPLPLLAERASAVCKHTRCG